MWVLISETHQKPGTLEFIFSTHTLVLMFKSLSKDYTNDHNYTSCKLKIVILVLLNQEYLKIHKVTHKKHAFTK